MKKFFSIIRNHYSEIIRASIFLLAIAAIVSLLPHEARFKYEYQKGRPWMHKDLIAPFNFAILKSPETLKQERDEMIQNRKYYFVYKTDDVSRVRKTLINGLENSFERVQNKKTAAKYKANCLSIFDDIMKIGVIENIEISGVNNDELSIVVLKNNVATQHLFSDYFSVKEAMDEVEKRCETFNKVYRNSFTILLQDAIIQSLKYHKDLSDKELALALESISITRGTVQEGERIVSQGELISEARFLILESLRGEYENMVYTKTSINWLMIGQVILVLLLFTVLVLYLYFFSPNVFADNKQITLILLIIVVVVFITSMVVRFKPDLLYLLPICLVPIMIRVFFNAKLALFVNIITVMILGFLVPNGFEYVFVQMLTGIFTVFAVMNLRRRAQFMIAAGLAFVSYSTIYYSLSLIQEASPLEANPIYFLHFAISAGMLMFAYPLIFLFEGLFGMITDVRLMELVQINNNKLLRMLSEKAPGTLQHSLQVANMAEEAVFAIGGNTLLVQAGAMYHDIGKMEMPVYFTENQSTGINPHSDLSPSESAEIITSHVIKGIELARKYRVPDQIVNFIRMHHGTRKASFFWYEQNKQFPDEDVDASLFTYHGPVPHSKETAVLMMVDSIEAASRSLKTPDEQTISQLIDKIIKEQLDDGQFVNADITMKDISTVKRILKQKLLNVYHVRVAYPS